MLIITTEQDPFTIEGEELAEKVRMVEGHNVVCHRMRDVCMGGIRRRNGGARSGKLRGGIWICC
jgi:uncharacterized protein YbjQ (UPF0145 family)